MTVNASPIFEYGSVLTRVVDASKTEKSFQKVEEQGDRIHFTLYDDGEGIVHFEVLPDVIKITYNTDKEPSVIVDSTEGLAAWIDYCIFECFLSD